MKKIIVSLFIIAAVIFTVGIIAFNTTASEQMINQVSNDNSENLWVDIGQGYYALKADHQYFEGVSPHNKIDCFPSEYSYKNLKFLLGDYGKDKARSRMDLIFNKEVDIPNTLYTKLVPEVYLLIGGNIGNVYLGTNNYIYYTDVNLTFKYKDGTQAKVSAEVPWDWSGGTDRSGKNYERIYLGQNPCDQKAAFYLIKYTNPYFDKEVERFIINDNFELDYPYTDIIAITVATKTESVAIPTEWDIAIRFDQAYRSPFYPFSSVSGQARETYYEKLNKTDNLYEEYIGREACASSYWGDIYDKEPKARRAKGWYVERKEISPSKYQILIRGTAWADCDYEGYGYAQGEFSVNENSGWKITKVEKCSAQSSNKGQETYCLAETNKVSFAAGNNCGGCCACADSGSLDIEIILEKSGKKLIRAMGDYKVYIAEGPLKRWVLSPEILKFHNPQLWEAVQEVAPVIRDFYWTTTLVRTKDDYKVYEINDDITKHWLNMTPQDFIASGRRWEVIQIIDRAEFDLYKTGPDVMIIK